MKKTLLLTVAVMMSMAAVAQTVNIHRTDGTVINYPASEVSYIDFSAAENTGGTAPAAAEAVDLGLPSGTKWANMNVGAEAPEDYGLYFAWGETVGYGSDTSDGRSFDWASYKWMNEGKSDGSQINKYQIQDGQTSACWYQLNEDYEFIGDGKAVLNPEDDAAHANWGGDWRMPTYEDFQELLANTTSEWITVGTVTGRRFVSKTNGNSIFLPAAGYRSFSSLDSQSTFGYYWSSNLSYSTLARLLGFHPEAVFTDGDGRYNGHCVRPVQ